MKVRLYTDLSNTRDNGKDSRSEGASGELSSQLRSDLPTGGVNDKDDGVKNDPDVSNASNMDGKNAAVRPTIYCKRQIGDELLTRL